METKFNEIVVETADVTQMYNKYLAEKLVRKWTEDFVDEDTGDVVQIERNELVMQKGTFLDNNSISEVLFFIESGDVKTVKVSDVPRPGTTIKTAISVYVVTIEVMKKKQNYYLYANSVGNSIDIATDYLEQTINGGFSFVGVKALTYSTLIPEPAEVSNVEHDSDTMECYFYSIEMEILKEDYTYTQSYIVRAKNAEVAKETIEKFIISNLPEDEKGLPIELSILSAKTINCENVIDYKFSKAYFENENKD